MPRISLDESQIDLAIIPEHAQPPNPEGMGAEIVGVYPKTSQVNVAKVGFESLMIIIVFHSLTRGFQCDYRSVGYNIPDSFEIGEQVVVSGCANKPPPVFEVILENQYRVKVPQSIR